MREISGRDDVEYKNEVKQVAEGDRGGSFIAVVSSALKVMRRLCSAAQLNTFKGFE